MDTEHRPPMPVLGRYRIDRPLGRGAMGSVYLAFDTTLHRPVALKVIEDDSAGSTPRARVVHEARNAAALTHPNICTIHEAAEADGVAFIAMEYVDGRPLRDRIDEGALPLADVLRLGVQAADALEYAHERGVIHRDFKAGNAIVSSDGRLKVVDFGLARRSDPLMAGATTAPSLAAAGTIAGTPYAMAPEQVRGEPADRRTDVWALGVLLYEMASGARPFAGATAPELFSAILHDAPGALPGTVPAALQAIVARCLAKDPDRRFQHARDVGAALAAVEAGTVPLWVVWQHHLRRQRWLVPAGGIVALVLLLVGLDVGRLRERLGLGGPLATTIAVLPLETVSGDADEDYFASGFHQELITGLAELPGFERVIARGSTLRFARSDQPVREVAEALGVDVILTATLRRTGDLVELTAQLTDGVTERHVWGESYAREVADVIALRNDVALAVADALGLPLTADDRQQLAAAGRIRPETYEAYLRGMAHFRRTEEGRATPEDRQRGIAYLQEAIALDEGDAHAWAGLAQGYAAMGHGPDSPPDVWTLARAAAMRAVTLAPGMAEAHAVLATIKMYFEWDWTGAEQAFRRANDLNPNLAMNHYHYSWYLALFDRLDEAIAEHRRAQELDPLTPLHTAYLGDLYVQAGRYEEARTEARKSLAMSDNSFPVGWFVLGRAYAAEGRHAEALEAMEKAAAVRPPWTYAVGLAHAAAGREAEAREVLRRIQSRPVHPYNAWARATLHAALGDRDEFFQWIAYEPHHGWVPWTRIAPHPDAILDDPRFAELMTRMNLPPRRAR